MRDAVGAERTNQRARNRSARFSNGMTQTSSGDHRGHQTSMEYAKLCMSMQLRNARYSAMQSVSLGLCRGRRGLGQVPEAM